MEREERYFEMLVVTELIEQEFAALRHWIDLRKQAIDQCRNCPTPPQDVVKQLLNTGDEVLHRLGQINRLVSGREATFARPAGTAAFDQLLPNGRAAPQGSAARTRH